VLNEWVRLSNGPPRVYKGESRAPAARIKVRKEKQEYGMFTSWKKAKFRECHPRLAEGKEES